MIASTSKIFIGTIKAGGVGLTLTAANQVILVDRPWMPGDANQSEDRCYRIGQNNRINAYWIQLGAIDEAIDSLLAEKRDRIELVLKGKRKTQNPARAIQTSRIGQRIIKNSLDLVIEYINPDRF